MAGTKMSGGSRTMPQPSGKSIGSVPAKAPTRPVIKSSGSSSGTRMSGGTKKGIGNAAQGGR